MSAQLEICVINASKPKILTKKIALHGGELVTTPSANMYSGTSKVLAVDSMQAFADVLGALKPNQALTYGRPILDKAKIVTSKALGELSAKKVAEGSYISRTRKCFDWPSKSGILVLDYDPAKDAEALTPEEFYGVIQKVIPSLSTTGTVQWLSSSSNIYDTDGKCLRGISGQRLYILIKDSADAKRAGDVLAKRLWLAGHGSIFITKAGVGLVRCPIDTTVWQPERLDFAAGASCGKGLEQRRGEPNVNEGQPLDTRIVINDLSPAENERYDQTVRTAKEAVEDEAAQVKNAHTEESIKALVAKNSNLTEEQARSTINAAKEKSTLYRDHVLLFQDGRIATVGEVLAEPRLYDGQSLQDPIEPTYNNNHVCAICYCSNTKPIVHTQAHGGQDYLLLPSSAPLPEDLSRAEEVAQRLHVRLMYGFEYSYDNPSQVSKIDALGIDVDVIHRIIKSTIYSGKQSLFTLVNADLNLVVFKKPDVWRMIRRIIGNVLDATALNALVFEELSAWEEFKGAKPTVGQINAFKKATLGAPEAVVLDEVLLANQCAEMSITVDPFINEPVVNIDNSVGHIVLPFKPFKTGDINQAIIDDFKEHFALLDTFLEFLVMSRFAIDRKKFFLWLRCQSDWGKGYLSGLLDELSLVIDVTADEIEMLYSGKPVGQTASLFTHAWILLVDELEKVKPAIKKLQSKIRVTPKHQLTSQVQVYTKLFTTQDEIRGMITDDSCVEPQYGNRFSMFACNGSLVTRALYTNNTYRYNESIKNYIAEYLNEGVKRCTALGVEEAANASGVWIEEFRKTHSLPAIYAAEMEVENDDGEIITVPALETDQHKEIGLEFLQYVSRHMPNYFKIKVDTNGKVRDNVYLATPTALYEAYLKQAFLDADIPTLYASKGVVFERIFTRHRSGVVKGISVKCQSLFVKDDEGKRSNENNEIQKVVELRADVVGHVFTDQKFLTK